MSLQPLVFARMTVNECEATQRVLLYPWERAAFANSEPLFDPFTEKLGSRGLLYALLEQRSLDALEEEIMNDPTLDSKGDR